MGPCDGEGPRRDELLLGSAVLAVHVLNAAARHLARLPSQGPSAPAKTMNGQRTSVCFCRRGFRSGYRRKTDVEEEATDGDADL
jgi:hypothetical protein